jgi:predicted ATPase/DNA-binding SARP family transcriptional activator
MATRFGILGPLEGIGEDGRPIALGGFRQRSVLAILLVHRPEAVPRERLVDLVWGMRPPPSATKTLQAHVSRLRSVLGAGLIVNRGGGYALATGTAELDAERFTALAGEGRRALAAGDAATAADVLRRALALWRGPPLAEFAYESFAQGEIARLTEERLAAFEDRIDAELALGDDAALIGELEATVREHPLRERLHGQLMLALYRTGRQADALDTYRRAREHLTGELGLEPGVELRALQNAILNQDPSLSADPSLSRAKAAASDEDRAAGPQALAPGAIPPRGRRVIGRERELAEVGELLSDPGVALVTLTGTGGIGKTTVALEAARAAMAHFPDGVTVVWLASIVSERQLLTELARVLEIELSAHETALDAIARVLGAQRRLIVLDNFEHVVAAAPAIGDLAASCPHLALLVTSRRSLRVGPERVYRVEPLAIAGNQGGAAEALFIERATAADSRFAVADAEAQTVSDLCRQLGGLPLALELAAARTAVLSPGAILERLRTSGETLGPARADAPERQRTLEATIDWSFELIGAAEQALCIRLAVFTAGFTADSAESVCGAAHLNVLDGLATLLDHGLIHRVGARHGVRLAMLEPIRDYCLARLRAAPDRDELLSRYAEHYASFAADAQTGLHGRDQLAWLDRVDDEQSNLRAILQGASSHPQLDAARRIAASLSRYWYVRDLASELVAWLTRALAHPPGDRAVRARALYTLGWAAKEIGDWSTAAAALAECLEIGHRLPDSRLTALCESLLALHALHQGRMQDASEHRRRAIASLDGVEDPVTRAQVLLNVAGCAADGDDSALARLRSYRLVANEAVELYGSVGDLFGLPYAQSNLGWSAWLAGDHELARASLDQALVGAQAISVTGLQAVIRANLGLLELVEGRPAPAREHLRAAITDLARIGDVKPAREALVGLAALAAAEGSPERSARLLAIAPFLHDGPPGPGEELLHDRYLRDLAQDPAARRSHVTAGDLETILSEIADSAP